MMNDLISRQAAIDTMRQHAHFDDFDVSVVDNDTAITALKDLPSATCCNLEKPEIPQHSEGEAADCNLDCISRQMLLEYIHGEPVGKLLCDKYNLDGLIEQFPSVQPNLQPTCNQLATDCISRQAAIRVASGYCHPANIADELRKLPSAQPTLYGYDIEHLILIANVLRKENLPPERVVDALTDIGRIVSIVTDEFEETLRRAVRNIERRTDE